MSSNNAIDTYSEEWRHICEAKHIAKMRVDDAEEFLNGIAKKRGVEAAHKLRFDSLVTRAMSIEATLKEKYFDFINRRFGSGIEMRVRKGVLEMEQSNAG